MINLLVNDEFKVWKDTCEPGLLKGVDKEIVIYGFYNKNTQKNDFFFLDISEEEQKFIEEILNTKGLSSFEEAVVTSINLKRSVQNEVKLFRINSKLYAVTRQYSDEKLFGIGIRRYIAVPQLNNYPHLLFLVSESTVLLNDSRTDMVSAEDFLAFLKLVESGEPQRPQKLALVIGEKK